MVDFITTTNQAAGVFLGDSISAATKDKMSIICKLLGHNADYIDTSRFTATCKRCNCDLRVGFDKCAYSLGDVIVPVWKEGKKHEPNTEEEDLPYGY